MQDFHFANGAVAGMELDGPIIRSRGSCGFATAEDIGLQTLEQSHVCR